MDLESYVSKAREEMRQMPVDRLRMYAYGLSLAKFCSPGGFPNGECIKIRIVGHQLEDAKCMTPQALDNIIETIAMFEYKHKFSGIADEVSEVNRYIEAYRPKHAPSG